MFERYNIDDLFLASISVICPENDILSVAVGGLFMTEIAGYGYLTVIAKDGDKYIDLQDMSRKITTTRDPMVTSYMIDYIEPLSKYYTQEGKEKKTFSRRKALIESKKYYDIMHQEHLKQI